MIVVTADLSQTPRRAVGLLSGAILGLLAACGGGGSEPIDPGLRADDPSGGSRDGLNVDGGNYPLFSAIGEIWGRGGDWPTHFNVDFTLTDGRFAVTSIIADGVSVSVRDPAEATAVLTAELYAPGATAFRFADYDFVAEPDAIGAIENRHFFVRGRVGVDADGNGNVERREFREVMGGTINFEGPLPDISLTFDVLLEDGATASGSYRGLFEFIPLEPARES